MSDVLNDYRTLNYPLPSTNISWRMHEAGVENFGRNGGFDELPLRRPGPDEVLVRVDAIGICFSDVKLVTQGSSHPRITGRDLAAEPVVPGHEVSLTVVEAGDCWKDAYKPGDRFIVQADVYYKGVNIAYGYALEGGMQQYGIIGKPVLDGDEGSYLVPVKPETGYAEAALVEPWTCVVASYRIAPRRTLKPGGVALIVGVEPGSYTLGSELCRDGAPSKVILSGIGDGVELELCNCDCCSTESVQIGQIAPGDVKALSQERTGEKGFDDVIVLGAPMPELAEALAASLAKDAVMAIVARRPMERPLQVDVGRVHYDYIDYVGAATGSVSDAYANNRDSRLTPGGATWFVGGAGAMGQMHVQLAARSKDHPGKILVTDVDNARMEHLKSGVADSAAENGIEMVYLNVAEAGDDALRKTIDSLTGGRGFDDIVVLVPVPALIESSVEHLGECGLMNIFAGVPRGTIATLDLSAVFLKGHRFVGSSGSRPADMVDTLAMTEAGEVPTRNSLAAVGGIDAMAEGLRAVKEARFPGKTVIFPHIRMPLTSLSELKTTAPAVYEKLRGGQFWTQEAEDALLASRLDLE